MRSRHPTLQRALAFAAEQAPERGFWFVDVNEEEKFVSYTELFALAGAAAGRLSARGVKRGDRVAIVLPTGLPFLLAFMGTLYAGGIPVSICPPTPMKRAGEYCEFIRPLLSKVAPEVLVTEPRFVETLDAALADCSFSRTVLEPTDLSGEQPPELYLGEPSDTALIQFSSGSTSTPRGVALSQDNVAWQCSALEEQMNLVYGDHVPVGVSWLPLHHDMGLVGFVLTPIHTSCNSVLIRPEDFLVKPSIWLRSIATHKGTISSAPDFAYAMAVRRIRDEQLEGISLKSWKMALCGAEHVRASSLEKFAKRFEPYGFRFSSLRPVYGLAEATLAVTFSDRGSGPRFLGFDSRCLAESATYKPGDYEICSLGRPVTGAELRIQTAEGKPLDEGQVGRVAVRGQSVMHGYYEDLAATGAVLREGWLDTGDLGVLIDGELFVTGRAKEVIVVRGANHSAEEFERAALEVEGVSPGSVLAAGAYDQAGGEGLIVLVEAASRGARELAASVHRQVTASTGVTPREVLIVPRGALPRTSSGKLKRQEAARLYAMGGFQHRVSKPMKTSVSLDL